jgi:hypothetical protein
LKAPPFPTPASNDPTWPGACCGKARDELHQGAPIRGAGRWFGLDLEYHCGTVSPSHSDPGSIQRDSPWAEARCAELDDGKLYAIIHELRAHDSCTEAIKCALYLFRNRARMRYPKFHALGLCTSTGVLEAGCKVVIGTRLKRSGVHWAVSGTNAIIALRCSKRSGRFEDFRERRLTSFQAAA